MSLQRGSFGIEFDERPGFPYGKLGWIVVVIPAVALAALFSGVCRDESRPMFLRRQDCARRPFQKSRARSVFPFCNI